MPERVPKRNGEQNNRGFVIALVLSLGAGATASVLYENSHSDAAAAHIRTKAPRHRHHAGPSPSPAVIKPSPSELPSPTLAITPSPTPSHSETATPNTAAPTTHAAKAPLIVLDPGHDKITKYTIDKQTGLSMSQYPNYPEINEVYEVAREVEDALVKDGYRVMMTKSSANDSATLRERADLAIKNHADLEVSIHDDHTQTPKAFEAVYAQFIGGYRQHKAESPVVCRNQDAVDASLSAAKAIAHARTVATGMSTTLQKLNFDARTNLDGGNISMIDLFDCQAGVPAVYNEMGGLTGRSATTRLPETTLHEYAIGLVNGIETAVPLKQD